MLGLRVTDARRWRWDGRRPTAGAVSAVLGTPAVAFPSEAVGRLTEEDRFGPELLDPGPLGEELLLGVRHLSSGVGQQHGEVGAGRVEACEPVLPPTHCVGEVSPDAVVRRPRGVGGSGEPDVLRVGGLGVAAGVTAEGRLQARAVIGRGSERGDPPRVTGHGRQQRTPGVRPGGELLVSPCDGGSPQPESAGPVEHDAGGLGGRVALGVPGGQKLSADAVGLGGDSSGAGLGPLASVLRIEFRLSAGNLQCGEPVDLVGLERGDAAQEVMARPDDGQPIEAALLSRPRGTQICEPLSQRPGLDVAGGLPGGETGGVAGAEVGPGCGRTRRSTAPAPRPGPQRSGGQC